MSEEQAVYPRPGERNHQYDLTKPAGRIDPEKHPLVLAADEEVFTGLTSASSVAYRWLSEACNSRLKQRDK